MIGGCPLNSTYNFTIPSSAPSGQALFAWTWQNYKGNREYYMNCAAVQILSSAATKRETGDDFSSLPYIWKANLAGVNSCETSADEKSVYPNPGPDVEYGGDMNSTSPSTPGNCAEPRPHGKAYRPSIVWNTLVVGPVDKPSTTASPAVYYPYLNATKPVYTYSPQNGSPASSQENAATTPISPAYGTYHYPNMTRPYSSHSTSRSRTRHSTSTTSLAYSASRYGNLSVPLTHTTSALSSYTLASTPSSTPASTVAANSTSSSLPYVRSEDSANVNHLPCIPGTFICLSYNSYLTCDNNDGSDPGVTDQNIYAYPRPVAIGMECLPNATPAGSESQSYKQQDNTPTGYYRDDRIVRSQANGACNQDGSLRCSDGGSTFYMCAQGAWVYMGSVAPGTTCQDGEIAAS